MVLESLTDRYALYITEDFAKFLVFRFFFSNAFFSKRLFSIRGNCNSKSYKPIVMELKSVFIYGITKNMNQLLGWYHNFKDIFYCTINEKNLLKIGNIFSNTCQHFNLKIFYSQLGL